MIRRLMVYITIMINISCKVIASPVFSADWFSHHINDWDKYKLFFEGKSNLRCLEIGSYEGRSTLYIAKNICKNKDSIIYSFDTWCGSMEHNAEFEKDLFLRFSYNLKNFINKKQVIPIKAESKKTLINFLNLLYECKFEKFDFIYIDG